MKSKLKIQTTPSFLLDSAIRTLRLDGTMEPARLTKLARKADAFQRKYCPGKPSVTMAAFLSDSLPILNKKGNFIVHRLDREIAAAFGCSESSMRERKTKIKTERR